MKLKGVTDAAKWIKTHYMSDQVATDIHDTNKLLTMDASGVDLDEYEEQLLDDNLAIIKLWWEKQPQELWFNSWARIVIDVPPSEYIEDGEELVEEDWHYYDEEDLRYAVFGDSVARELEA